MISDIAGSPKSCHVVIEWSAERSRFVAFVEVWPIATCERMATLAQWATVQGASSVTWGKS